MCHITVKEDFKYYHLEIKYTTVIDVDKIYSKVTDFIDYKPAIDMITEKQTHYNGRMFKNYLNFCITRKCIDSEVSDFKSLKQ